RAEMLLEMFQDFYTEARILKVVLTGDDGSEVEEDVMLNWRDASGKIINDVTLGEYRVVVSSRTARDNGDDSSFHQLMEMRESGIMVPDWAIVETTNVEHKHEIAEWMRRTQGAAEPTEQ